jgi:hypothetical protein
MIRVLSITVYKAYSSEKIHYESFRDSQFETNNDIRDWIAYQEEKWTKIKKFDCKVYPVKRSKPQKSMDMNAVLVHTAHVMGQPLEGVLSGSRKRELVDIRKIACKIILDADYQPMEIERQLPFKNRTVYSYRESIEDRITTERGFEDKYIEIRDKVMNLMTPKS